MKQLRFHATFCLFSILAVLGAIALLNPDKAYAERNDGASYVVTFNDSNGNFASRGVITVHADHTIAVVDSGEGGPTFFFSSQLGSWKPDGKGGIVARTIDFTYPPNAATARLDYALSFDGDGDQVTGSVILTNFPLQANPLDGGGTVIGTFTITGELVKP
jgi:hypothetical protein